jgi:ADP-ribose pyrophosphatase
VVHPGAVVVLPLLEGDRVVMIRNYRHAVEKELWELPAGTREPGESPIETAGRELEEETGYRAGGMKPLCEFYTSPGVSTERMFAFVATDLTPVPQRLEDGEQIRVEVVPIARIRSMLMDGELADGKSIAVLARHLCERDGLLSSDAK